VVREALLIPNQKTPRAKPEHVSLTAQGKPVTLLEAIREGL